MMERKSQHSFLSLRSGTTGVCLYKRRRRRRRRGGGGGRRRRRRRRRRGRNETSEQKPNRYCNVDFLITSGSSKCFVYLWRHGTL
jgi:predicted amidophosphoribosyltransferase